MKTTKIQLIEGVNHYKGPQIVKIIGPYGAWAVQGIGAQNGKHNIAALLVRVDPDALQECDMFVTKFGQPLTIGVNAGTACLGTVLHGGVEYVVDSDCMAQP